MNHWLDKVELQSAFAEALTALNRLRRLAGHYGLPSEDRASLQIAHETVDRVAGR